MWELIAANKRRSLILLFGLGAVFLSVGAVIGAALVPDTPREGVIAGLGIASFLWAVLALTSYSSGDDILLASSDAHEVTPDIHPLLYNVVEEMKIASNLPRMPRIFIMDDMAPNAFATGIRAEKSAIAVTAGLMAKLDRDELQGVIAHEMSHVVNRDCLYMTQAAVTLGSIQLLSQFFLKGMRYSGLSRRYRSRASGGTKVNLVLVFIAIAFAILGPILAQMFYFAISRKREYLADASAVRLTRYPDGLARALNKIQEGSSHMAEGVSSVTAPLYIVNPLQDMRFVGLFSTHPPIEERIRILSGMGAGAGYAAYENAFRAVKGTGVLPGSALGEKGEVPVRAPSANTKESAPKKPHDAGDLIRVLNSFMFLSCVCGLRMKIPPEFKEPAVRCPRCGREAALPRAKGRPDSHSEDARHPLEYTRRGAGWETLMCSCEKRLQLSPAFEGAHIQCKNCGRKIMILSGSTA